MFSIEGLGLGITYFSLLFFTSFLYTCLLIIFFMKKYYRYQRVLLAMACVPLVSDGVLALLYGEFLMSEYVWAALVVLAILLLLFPVILAYWIRLCSSKKRRDYKVLLVSVGTVLFFIAWYWFSY